MIMHPCTDRRCTEISRARAGRPMRPDLPVRRLLRLASICLLAAWGGSSSLAAQTVAPADPATLPVESRSAPESRAAQAAAPADPAAEHGRVLRRYCVGCHNDRTLTAGLTLQSLDIARIGEEAHETEIWGKGHPQAEHPLDAAGRPAAARRGNLRRADRLDRGAHRRGRRRASEPGPAPRRAPAEPRRGTPTRSATCSRSTSTSGRCCRRTIRGSASTTSPTCCRSRRC